MLRPEIEHDVHFSGDNGSLDDEAQVDTWLAYLELSVIDVGRHGQPRDSIPPFGGRIAVRPGPALVAG